MPDRRQMADQFGIGLTGCRSPSSSSNAVSPHGHLNGIASVFSGLLSAFVFRFGECSMTFLRDTKFGLETQTFWESLQCAFCGKQKWIKQISSWLRSMVETSSSEWLPSDTLKDLQWAFSAFHGKFLLRFIALDHHTIPWKIRFADNRLNEIRLLDMINVSMLWVIWLSPLKLAGDFAREWHAWCKNNCEQDWSPSRN